MKTVLAVIVVALVCAASGYATSTAFDPRVSALKREVNSLKAQVSGKLDRSCVDTWNIVVRPGYYYQGADGSLLVYQALDEYHPEFGDTRPAAMMVFNPSCAS